MSTVTVIIIIVVVVISVDINDGCEKFIKTSVSFIKNLYTNIKEKNMQILFTELPYTIVLTIEFLNDIFINKHRTYIW